MTPDYLSVDCVVTKLIANNTLRAESNWKRTMPGTKSYNANFYRSGNNSLLVFYVKVINNIHCISTTSFINQSHYFKMDIDNILNDCAI
jgi:beta-glucosidase/6-phospho-beta-glucosidase/beta-galactosidase